MGLQNGGLPLPEIRLHAMDSVDADGQVVRGVPTMVRAMHRRVAFLGRVSRVPKDKVAKEVGVRTRLAVVVRPVNPIQ